MDQQTNKRAPRKRPFKQTRELVRIALSDGLTQTDIAKMCRTQQSLVSEWKRGTKYGTETTLKPLLEKYGYKLRRNSFRLYWTLNVDSEEKIFSKVEGKVIFSESLTDLRRSGAKLEKKIPTKRLVIHDQGAGLFRLIEQNRFRLSDSSDELECSQEDARWNSIIHEPLNLSSLLDMIDRYAKNISEERPSDAHNLPFLLRRALLNHGFELEGIVEYQATW